MRLHSRETFLMTRNSFHSRDSFDNMNVRINHKKVIKDASASALKFFSFVKKTLDYKRNEIGSFRAQQVVTRLRKSSLPNSKTNSLRSRLSSLHSSYLAGLPAVASELIIVWSLVSDLDRISNAKTVQCNFNFKLKIYFMLMAHE